MTITVGRISAHRHGTEVAVESLHVIYKHVEEEELSEITSAFEISKIPSHQWFTVSNNAPLLIPLKPFHKLGTNGSNL